MMSPDHLADGSRVRTPWLMVNALGLYVFVMYGITYYAISAAAPRMAADLGVAPSTILGLLSGALLLTALLAPVYGLWIDRLGAGPVLLFGALARVGALVAMALAPDLPAFILALRDPRQRRSRALWHPRLCNMARSSWHGPAHGIGRRSLRPRVGIGARQRGQRRHDVRDDGSTFCGMLRRARTAPALILRTTSRCKRPVLPTVPFNPLDHAD